MKTKLMILTCLLPMLGAKAEHYGRTIDYNRTAINHNAVYAKAEEAYADRLNNSKKQLARDIESYRKAHVRAMKSEARVRELEANMPAHREYVSDWNYGSTSLTWGTR